MILILLEKGVDSREVEQTLRKEGLWVRPFRGTKENLLLVEPSSAQIDIDILRAIPGISDVAEMTSSHPLVDKQSSQIVVKDVVIGPGAPRCIIAGPCSIESESQVQFIAEYVAKAGAKFLRGGAFKPRTSPYSFQGHGAKALQWLQSAAREQNLGVVTEVLDTYDVSVVAECADLIQIGARNMYNYALLKSVGRTQKVVLLKRGFSATIEEWLSSAEYCLMQGAKAVIFCERGIRSFDPSTRNLLDLGAVALLSHVKHLPVIVDPSHALGRKDLISPLSKAAMAAGACGLMIETHFDPGQSFSDGPQALRKEEFTQLIADLQAN